MKTLFGSKKNLFFVAIISGFLFLLSSNSFAEVKTLNITKLKEFVDSGLEYIKKVGPEKAYKEFSDTHGKFVKNEKYLFVYTYDGKCLAHGGDPKYVGNTLLSYKNKFDMQPVQIIIDVAKRGGGFAGFYWPNPKNNQEEFKIVYVKPIDDKTLISAGYFVE